ncbi:hypothetical protein [Cryobacterium arcticum]|uniref:Uncharacterized protein n=1 Tax=Cryobacterium arcticum TaxID=670052 RepID=A0A317ZRE2_9MICO|nr:hypothetical protein [Cryobacterium arcticum]PXA67324.1 hypothetical protein CTB96_11290 [Cryobacterium arcticum]
MAGPAIPNVPTRRNVKVLTDAIASLKSGTNVSAMFLTKRYGAFTIDGTAFISASVKTLTVGGRSIEQNLKPHKSLQALQPEPELVLGETDEATAETEPAPVVPLLAESGQTAPEVQHGDLISVRFIDPAYGPFTVTGVSVASTVSDVVLVGGWFVSQAGATAPRVASIEILAANGTHEYPLPPRIVSWGEDTEGATEY